MRPHRCGRTTRRRLLGPVPGSGAYRSWILRDDVRLPSIRGKRWSGTSVWGQMGDPPPSLSCPLVDYFWPDPNGYGHAVAAAAGGRDDATGRRYPAGQRSPCRAQQRAGIAALPGCDSPQTGVASAARGWRGEFGPQPTGEPTAANTAGYPGPPAAPAARGSRVLLHSPVRRIHPPRRCVSLLASP